MAKLWIVPTFENGACRFRCDSDSVIVRAIAGLLCEIAEGKTPAEILALSLAPLKEMGITDHLSANRRNALSKVWTVIRAFAVSHETLRRP